MDIKILFEKREMPSRHGYQLFLPVVTDDQFLAELSEMPVFTYVGRPDYGHNSCVDVTINPLFDVPEVTRQILPLVGALLMRSGAPEGVSFEKREMPSRHGYQLFLPVVTDDQFLAELSEMPVFTYVGRPDYGHNSCVDVTINPVIGVSSAKRQIMPLVKSLCKRRRATKTNA